MKAASVENGSETSDSELKWISPLEKALTRSIEKSALSNIIILKNKDGSLRDEYTDEEMKKLENRGFEVRLFMASGNYWWETLILRTHFSDHHPFNTQVLDFVRDYFKASTATNSYTSAKASLTRVLNIALDLEESEYCSLAVTLASGLSNHAAYTTFEKSDVHGFVNLEQDIIVRRDDFCKLMHIIFSKVQVFKFLVQQDKHNIFRLAHCVRPTLDRKFMGIIMPGKYFSYAAFSFLLQICLTGYVIAQLIRNTRRGSYTLSTQNENIGKLIENLPLAIMTLLYSLIIAGPEIRSVPKAMKVFGKHLSAFKIMDVVVNGILPTLLLIPGFFVILDQDEFIDAVLNAAALLYIAEIDDQIVYLLGLNVSNIVKDFLIHEAMAEFDAFRDANTITSNGFEEATESGMGVDFNDYYLTNVPERGSSPSDGVIYQPFQVSKGTLAGYGDQIDPSSFVTKKCLIRKLTWRYTIYNNTTKPRIGYLKIDLLADRTSVIIERPEGDNIKLGEVHSLEGVYIITTFQMGNDILSLRVCGSKKASDFRKAFKYYTLWSLTKDAKEALDKASKAEVVGKSVTQKNLDKVSSDSTEDDIFVDHV
mmetsp:Transcript_8256/g.15555  ORF Transcript_8256/g.15555 Transcript_8256/m.15555 type:complete len:594 (-) Transcript_8256:103-1884(-)